MNKQTSLIPCEACCKGHLHPKSDWDAVEYKGQSGKIYHHYSVCDVCGSELANAQQTLDNKREFVRFRKLVDNIPLGAEIAGMRKRFRLTQAQAGQLFGGGPVAFSKYEHDDIVPDDAMSNLLFLAIRHKDIVYKLAARKNFPLPHLPLVDNTLEWFKDKQGKNEAFRLVIGEFFDDMKLESFHMKPLKRKTSSAKTPSEKIDFPFGNSGNGEQSWTIQ